MKKQLLLTSTLLTAAVFTAQAAIIEWDNGGADTNWGTAANWSNNAVPTGPSADIYRFGVSPTTGTTTNDIVSLSLTRINTAGGAWTFNGNDLTLSNSGATTPRLFHNGSGDATYDMNLILSGTSPLLIDNRASGGADIVINGNISGTTGLAVGNTNTTAASAVVLTGTNTFTGGITVNAPGGTSTQSVLIGDTDAFNNNDITNELNAFTVFDQATNGSYSGSFGAGNGGIIKRGAGVLTIDGASVGALTAGGTAIEAGTLRLNNNGGLGDGDVVLGDTSGAVGATIQMGSSVSSINNNIVVAAGSTGEKVLSVENAGSSNVNLTGGITLNDDLTVDSVTTGRVTFIDGVITGSNDLTINANNQQGNRVDLSADNSASYSGTTIISRGRVYARNAGSFGTGTIQIGGGSTDNFAALYSANDVTSIDNDIVVDAGASQRRIANANFGPDADGATFTGNITLNSELQVQPEGVASGGDAVTLTGVISGTEGLEIDAAVDSVGLGGLNTYAGNTTITAGTMNLLNGGGLTFYIGADGDNNQILGAGTAELDGLFTFDLTGADSVGTWSIVASAFANYGANFQVAGFTESGAGVWESGNYTFTELTGNLTAVPEPGTYALLAGMLALASVMIRRRR